MDKFRGIIKEVRPPKNVSKNPEKQFFVQETIVQKTSQSYDGREFTNTLIFNSKGDNISKTQNLQPGMEVEVEFYINGREYQAKDGRLGVFVALDVKDVVPIVQQQYTGTGQPMYQQQAPQPQQPPRTINPADINSQPGTPASFPEEGDGLPF